MRKMSPKVPETIQNFLRGAYSNMNKPYCVVPNSPKEFIKRFDNNEQALAYIEQFGGKLVIVDPYGRRIKTVA